MYGQILTPILMGVLLSAGKDVYIIRGIGLNTHIPSMVPGIYQMGARSCETLVLSTLKVGLLSTTGNI